MSAEDQLVLALQRNAKLVEALEMACEEIEHAARCARRDGLLALASRHTKVRAALREVLERETADGTADD